MLHAKFEGHRPFGSRVEIFYRLNHMWAWWSSCSCDINYWNSLSCHYPMEAPHKIEEKRISKMLDLSDLGQRSLNDLDQ